MKLQLTKDKVIEFNFGGQRAKSPAEITGIELFSGDPRGFPAVKLIKRKGIWHLAAAEFVPPPTGEMPRNWDEVTKQPTWELPHQFATPHAAFAVNSQMATFSQATSDAIQLDMARGLEGLGASATTSAATEPGKRRFGIKRDSAPKPDAPAAAPAAGKFELPTPEDASSANGRRFALRPLAEEGFNLVASLPEFQTLWLSRLLPEGKRPTVSSIQVAESALMASLLLQPAFREAKGNALALFVRPDCIFLAGYKGGEPVLWRKCPNTAGENAMRASVVKRLGIGEDLLDAVLDEAIIDPRPALEPFVHPVLEQLELSRAYLASKHGMELRQVFLIGLTAGTGYWQQFAREGLRLELITPETFAGLELDKGVEPARPNDFLTALGAAIAAAEATL